MGGNGGRDGEGEETRVLQAGQPLYSQQPFLRPAFCCSSTRPITARCLLPSTTCRNGASRFCRALVLSLPPSFSFPSFFFLLSSVTSPSPPCPFSTTTSPSIFCRSPLISFLGSCLPRVAAGNYFALAPPDSRRAQLVSPSPDLITTHLLHSCGKSRDALSLLLHTFKLGCSRHRADAAAHTPAPLTSTT